MTDINLLRHEIRKSHHRVNRLKRVQKRDRRKRKRNETKKKLKTGYKSESHLSQGSRGSSSSSSGKNKIVFGSCSCPACVNISRINPVGRQASQQARHQSNQAWFSAEGGNQKKSQKETKDR